MTILQQPDSLSLTGNIRDFIVSSTDMVSFRLSVDGTDIVDERYTPNAQGELCISLTDILDAELSLALPAGELITAQPSIVRRFTAYIDGQPFTFTAIRGGIDGFEFSTDIYLNQNFLTSQPLSKNISREQPEYLSYYAASGGILKLKSGDAIVPLANLTAGKAYTFDLSYDQVRRITGLDPEAFEVWVEYGVGKSSVQKYMYTPHLGPDEEYFLWENSLGGLDVARFTGQSSFAPKQTHNLAILRKLSKEYRTDTVKLTSKNSGHKLRNERMWLHDFLMRKQRYKYVNGRIVPIVLEKSTLQYPSHEYVASFTFDYRFSDSKAYPAELDPDRLQAVAFWSDYRCQLQDTPLEYTFLFSENQDVQLTKSLSNAAQAVKVELISTRAGLPFNDIRIESIPEWLSVSISGLTLSLTLQENPTATGRSAAIGLLQGGSEKRILLTINQAAGTYRFTIAVEDTENLLDSRITLTLDNDEELEYNFVGSQSATVELPVDRKIADIGVDVGKKPNVSYSSIAIQTLPKLEVNSPMARYSVPFSRGYTLDPPLDADSSGTLKLTLEPEKEPELFSLSGSIYRSGSSSSDVSLLHQAIFSPVRADKKLKRDRLDVLITIELAELDYDGSIHNVREVSIPYSMLKGYNSIGLSNQEDNNLGYLEPNTVIHRIKDVSFTPERDDDYIYVVGEIVPYSNTPFAISFTMTEADVQPYEKLRYDFERNEVLTTHGGKYGPKVRVEGKINFYDGATLKETKDYALVTEVDLQGALSGQLTYYNIHNPNRYTVRFVPRGVLLVGYDTQKKRQYYCIVTNNS